MMIVSHGIDDKMMSLEELLEYGVIGFYKSCEAIQIFLVDRDRKYTNFFTIFTFEEGEHISKKYEDITNELIRIDKNFSMGIRKHYFSLNDSKNIFNKLHDSQWECENDIVIKGISFRLLPSQYVPSDNYNRINNILKNNFSIGSYIFEFFEEDKSDFRYFKENPKKLEKIIKNIHDLIPIDFSLNSDRFGNYIFQLPIKLLKIKKRPNDNFDGVFIDFIWNKKLLNNIPDCIINASIKLENNFLSNVLVDYNKETSQLINTGSIDNVGEISIWRKNPNLLLFNGETRFFKKVYGGLTKSKGTREFYNEFGKKSVKLRSSLNYKKEYDKYIQIIEDTKSEILENDLERSCSFKLYGNNQNEEIDDEKNRECLVNLIQKYGSNGVYLLDPYLTYEEILSTLYYSNTADVPLRAITSKKAFNQVNVNYTFEFIKLNKEKLENSGNNLNLNLKFRIEKGENSFHDRFLIFPENPKKLEKARAYSLGTSVNGFGKSYHILQEIPTPKKIVTLFEDLWSKLEDEEYLIWKHN